MKQQSPMLRLWELGAAQHGSLIRAILSAVAGVMCGMAPYFAAAQIILGLLFGNPEFSFYPVSYTHLDVYKRQAHALPEGLANLAVPALVFLAMFFVDWKLALLSLCALPLGLVAMMAMYLSLIHICVSPPSSTHRLRRLCCAPRASTTTRTPAVGLSNRAAVMPPASDSSKISLVPTDSIAPSLRIRLIDPR